MSLCRRVLLRHALATLSVTCAAPAAGRARHRPHRARPTDHTRAPHHPLPLVVIDPGHGGKDPGCIGHGGTEEKTVMLALGKELRRELHASRYCRVAMTRESDVFVPLHQRVQFARRQGATLFISLHANSSPHSQVRGACVYRFAYRASDAKARALARWENSADRFGGPAFQNASPTLTHILASLMRRETWLHSAHLQESVVTALDRRTRLVSVPARYARFVVLSAPDIASVLIETGFLTNHAEEALLRSKRHQAVLARSIRQAVERQLVAISIRRAQRGLTAMHPRHPIRPCILRVLVCSFACLIAGMLPPAASLTYAAPPLQRGTQTHLPLPRFAALKASVANLRRGPGARYPIEWVYHRRNLPVLILREFYDWRLLRLPDGTRGWMHRALLSRERRFVVIAPHAVVRQTPHDYAAAIARLRRGVTGALHPCQRQAVWCAVESHGFIGFLRRTAIWGSDADTDPLTAAPRGSRTVQKPDGGGMRQAAGVLPPNLPSRGAAP